jgi:hypothetical protein
VEKQQSGEKHTEVCFVKAKFPSDAMPLQKGAKLLMKDGFETSPRKIFEQLRQLHWMDGRVPSSAALQDGLLVKAEGSFHYGASDGEEAYARAGITYKGLAVLEEFLKKNETDRADKANKEKDLFGVNAEVNLGNGNKCELGF